jgi:mevalonate kinase
MLFGEHAVLHGHLALVGAVSQRLRVTLTPHAGSAIHIRSALGEYASDLRNPAPSETFRFMVAALRVFADDLPSGFSLQVESEFSSTIGFGSSAAVTVATVGALLHWSRGTAPADQVFSTARRLIRDVQGAGSGADVAASVHGGLVLYRAEPLEIEPLPHTHPLTAVYSGSKLATPLVIAPGGGAAQAVPADLRPAVRHHGPVHHERGRRSGHARLEDVRPDAEYRPGADGCAGRQQRRAVESSSTTCAPNPPSWAPRSPAPAWATAPSASAAPGPASPIP